MDTRAATAADGERLMQQMPPSRRAKFSTAGFASDLNRSIFAFTGVEPDGAVVNIAGLMDTGRPGIGYVWQVIDPAAVVRNKRAYLRQGRQLLALAHRLYPRLTACFDPGNAASWRYARRLGWHFVGAGVLPDGAIASVFERDSYHG